MQVVCPACGVSAEVSDETFEQGVVICANCGKRVRLGRLTAATADAEYDAFAQSPDDRPDDRPDDFTFIPPTNAVAPSRKPPQRAHLLNKRLAFAAVCALAGAMMAVLVMVVRYGSPHGESPVVIAPPINGPASMPSASWDRLHRSDLLLLKSRADQLAMSGSWQQSYEIYQQIISMVGDHDLTDPVAIQLIAGTRAGQDRVMQALVAGRSTNPGLSAEQKTALASGVATAPPPPTASLIPAAVQPAGLPVAVPTTGDLSQPAIVQLDPAQSSADNAPPLPGEPTQLPSMHAYSLPDAVTDAQIGDAIANGVKFLSSRFQNGQIIDRPTGRAGKPQAKPAGGPMPKPHSNLDDEGDLEIHRSPTPAVDPATFATAFNVQGIDALCVYALLHSGQALDAPGQKVMAVDDPLTLQILERLKSYNLQYTYHRSLRAAALAVFNRSQDLQTLEDDVRWLLTAGPTGAYSYTLREAENLSWDNSNSQYGLLGVWSGASVGMSISQNYWRSVIDHWSRCVNGNGTFGYTMGDASTTMTCAGVASLLVARDYIDNSAANSRMPERPSPLPALDGGLRWLDDGDNCISNLSGDGLGGAGYGLYGLERVGLASGYKYFGRHDWYSELAARLVAEQHLDGSWGTPTSANGVTPPQTLVDTAYALLFLARGRHPVLFNKLRYDGDWNDRPNDVSHLAKYAAHALERPLNWQVVNLRRNWFDWMDSPVLYLSGDKAINLTPQDLLALREFAIGGGLIFTHADGGSVEFTKWVNRLVRDLFPKYELMTVPRDHAIYSTVYSLKNPPPLMSVSNGSRVLLVHSPTDLAGGWQLNWTDEHKPEFQLGVNLFVYAAGKGILKNRLSSIYIPADPSPAQGSRQIARLEYPAEWDPEPYAWTRFARYFQWETQGAIEPLTVPMKSLVAGSVPMAVLTGTVSHDFTGAECLAAKEYVRAGGVLFIDACGGSSSFTKSVQTTLIPLAFAGATLQNITDTHPMLINSRAGAYDLRHPLLRSYANQNGGKEMPIQVTPFGKGWVIFSRLDLTAGLLGTQQWGILGYDPAYAQALMKNTVLWAQARMPANPR